MIGDPNQKTAELMKPLYAPAYGIRKLYKDKGCIFKVEKSRGRWPDINATQSKDHWVGTYALPVPNDVTALPPINPSKNTNNIKIKLQTWEYGKVAYILHIGSYSKENESIKSLLNYISANGMKVIENSHEEIYLSDPTKTVRDKLKTILLYRLQ